MGCARGGTRLLSHIDAICHRITNGQESELRRLLGIFALGDRAGMSVQQIASQENMSSAALTGRLTHLADAGIVSVHSHEGETQIVVQPAALRHALINDTFFSKVPLAWSDYAPLVLNSDDVTFSLIGTAHRGAPVDRRNLQTRVMKSENPKVWQKYASLGPDETRALPEQSRERLRVVCDQALDFCSEIFLDDLLHLAFCDEGVKQSITQWVQTTLPGQAEAVVRRQLVIGRVNRLELHGVDSSACLDFLNQIFWPEYEDNVVAPGSGTRWSSRSGMLQVDQIVSVASLWMDIRDWFQKQSPLPWKEMVALIQRWAVPHFRHSLDPSASVVAELKLSAIKFLADLAEMPIQNQAVIDRLEFIVAHLPADIRFSTAQDYKVLFPWPVNAASPKEFDALERERLENVRQLAKCWAERPAIDVAEQIARMYRARHSIEANSCDLTWHLCSHICESKPDITAWAKAFYSAKCPAHLTGTFVWNAVSRHMPGIDDLLNELVHDPEFRAIMVQMALREPEFEPQLGDEILKSLGSQDTKAVEECSYYCKAASLQLIGLLAHGCADVRLAAAIAIDHIYENGIPEELVLQWKGVIVELPKKKMARWRLEKVVQRYPDLAYPILLENLALDWSDDTSDGHKALVDCLSGSERRQLISKLPGDCSTDLVTALVGESVRCYRLLQTLPHSKDLKLAPLRTCMHPKWVKFAEIAVEEGATDRDFLRLCEPWDSVFGNQSDALQSKYDRLVRAKTKNQRLHRILQKMIQHLKSGIQELRDEEHFQAVYGWTPW